MNTYIFECPCGKKHELKTYACVALAPHERVIDTREGWVHLKPGQVVAEWKPKKPFGGFGMGHALPPDPMELVEVKP
jgi:hypothetical protein